jgi:hypothetical protein
LKGLLSLILLFFVNSVLSQEDSISKYDLVLYETYDDFKQNKGINKGKMLTYQYSTWGSNIIKLVSEENVNLNDYWGFTVNEYLFRMNKFSLRIPMFVYVLDKKVFYIDGYLVFNKIAFNSKREGRTIRESDAIFYSDNLNSEVYKISKFTSREKNNIDYQDLVTCFNLAKKRYGYQAQFNGRKKCLNQFFNIIDNDDYSLNRYTKHSISIEN